MAKRTTEASFVQAVCETPDDDAPRLVFADWLEDNGQSERADALVRSPIAANLRTLRLPALSPEAARILLTAPSLSGLRRLDVTTSSGPPDGEIGKLLRAATHLCNLRHLKLECCGLGDAGLAALADSPHLAGLRSLDVSRNGLSGVGLNALADSPYFNYLHKLSVAFAYGQGADEGRKRLRERYGDAMG